MYHMHLSLVEIFFLQDILRAKRKKLLHLKGDKERCEYAFFYPFLLNNLFNPLVFMFISLEKCLQFTLKHIGNVLENVFLESATY